MRLHAVNDDDVDGLVDDRLRRLPKHQSVLENRRSLSARLNYATSSYSSHHFCFKDSDENHDKKRTEMHRSRHDDSVSSRR